MLCYVYNILFRVGMVAGLCRTSLLFIYFPPLPPPIMSQNFLFISFSLLCGAFSYCVVACYGWNTGSAVVDEYYHYYYNGSGMIIILGEREKKRRWSGAAIRFFSSSFYTFFFILLLVRRDWGGPRPYFYILTSSFYWGLEARRARPIAAWNIGKLVTHFIFSVSPVIFFYGFINGVQHGFSIQAGDEFLKVFFFFSLFVRLCFFFVCVCRTGRTGWRQSGRSSGGGRGGVGGACIIAGEDY